MRKLTPFLLAAVAFVISVVVLSHLIGPARCRDGWASPSIGSRGACSWHGGVDHTPGILKFWASVAAAVGAWYVSSRKLSPAKSNPPQQEPVPSAQTFGPRPPKSIGTDNVLC